MSTEPRTSNLELREAPAGFWQREVSHYPKPLTPLGSSLVLEGINQSFRKVFDDFGLLLETLEFREIGGYVYQTAKPYGVNDSGGGRMPPKVVLWLVLRLHPTFRRRIARNKQVVLGRRDLQLVEQWYNEWKPELIADIERLRRVDLSGFSNEQLAGHLDESYRWLFHAFDVHFYLTPAYAYPIFRLAFFLRDQLGYDDAQMLSLLTGLSEASSEPALALAELAERVRQVDGLAASLASARPEDVPLLLAQGSPEVARAFDEYLHKYGCRALRYELVEQCLDEQPALVAGLLLDQLQSDIDFKTEQARLREARLQAQERARLALPESVRGEFEALLADAERAYPIREDNEFYTVSVPLALTRRAVLEAGKRLAAGGAVASGEDVFFLRSDELVAALRGDGGDHRQLVERRRADMAAAESFDPPASYGSEPPLPPMDVLPPEMRLAMEGALYSMQKVFEPEQSNRRVEAGVREIQGIAAAQGEYTGTARIVMGEEQFDKLRAGDVLVCPITSPVWSVLFAKVGALVTDTGGILSHPAIIAREYGIPAVVATGNATEVLSDGQRVLVDGRAGLVKVLES